MCGLAQFDLLNAARSYSLRPTQLNKEKKPCLILAALLRALRAELSPANVAAQNHLPAKLSLATSNLAKMAAAVVHHTAAMPLATKLAASRATQQKTAHVVSLQALHAKPAVAAQTTPVTGHLAKIVQPVAVALPPVALPATTAHHVQTTTVRHVASGQTTAQRAATTTVQLVANGPQSVQHAATMLLVASGQTTVRPAATMTVRHAASGLQSVQHVQTTTVLLVASGQTTAQHAATTHLVATGTSIAQRARKTAPHVVSGQPTAQHAMATVAALVPTAMLAAATA